jgi:hypothetical protein
MNKRRLLRITALTLVIGLSGAGTVRFAGQDTAAATVSSVSALGSATSAPPAYTFDRLANPARTQVRDSSDALVATFTDGSRTAVVTGQARTFREPKATASTVTTTTSVRLAPRVWNQHEETADWFQPWLEKTRTSTKPDILAIAMQYLDGARVVKNDKKLRIAGDAAFGNADFTDYLGIAWDFPDGQHENADPGRYGSVDDPGFIRLVYGYRGGYPLRGENTGGGLPRSAAAMSQTGTPVISAAGRQATEHTRLQPGDLVFFDSRTEPQVGIYLGVDSEGHHRVLSSRAAAGGPTFGDLGGKSILDSGGLVLRSAERL